jgi:hypothetical protein
VSENKLFSFSFSNIRVEQLNSSRSDQTDYNLTMLDNQNKKIGFVLTLITFGHSIFTCLISYIIFIVIIYHFYYNRVKREDKVTVLICANIYLFLSIYTTMGISMNIQTILGDLYGQSFDSSWCMFSGYMSLVTACALFMAFVNQVIRHNVI